ncbi:branched chain amino acid ABC transporter substrate-binding protein [Pandoraea terrigena]|uniref:Branched chain amino acid ABC transporter substrate-binding protein n=2 Tax=Pandoraea terrigena TaxID=2508292 RepID=A0A5E4UCV9_9BURK|nr:branched chain amino acid ABC transporter substrate-binding protein [Pandoraea terrigena]
MATRQMNVWCVAVSLSLGTAAAVAHAQTVVKIGSVAPLTGSMAHVGKDNENGARLAIEEINAQGLVIGGQKITLQLDSQDDAGDPRQATQVAQKLVDDNVIGVVGHLNSGTTIPASKIYSDAGLVQVSPSATDPVYTQQGFRTSYRMVGTDAQQGPALAKYIAETLKVKTLAIVDDSTAYGEGLANQFQKAAEALGIKVLSHDATNDKAIDFRAILTKIKGEDPDAIMVGAMDPTGGPFARQARQLGLRAKILGGDGMCTARMPLLAGEAADNVVCSEAGEALEKMPQGAAFAAKYEKRFGEPIQIYAPFSYDAVYVIVDAMKRANSIDPAKILAAMPSTDYAGVTGRTKFDAHGDLSHGVITLYTYKGGKKTILDMVTL